MAGARGGGGRRRQVSDLLLSCDWARRSAAAANLQRMYIDLFVYHFFCKHYSLSRDRKEQNMNLKCIVLVTGVC